MMNRRKNSARKKRRMKTMDMKKVISILKEQNLIKDVSILSLDPSKGHLEVLPSHTNWREGVQALSFL
jgi:hypothetical protein